MTYRRRMLDSDIQEQLRLLAPGETVTFMGRCCEKGCRHGARVEVPGFVEVTNHPKRSRFGDTAEAWSERADITARGWVFPAGTRWVTGASYATEDLSDDHCCPEHLTGYTFKGLRSVLVSTVACSATCTEAIGEKCRCSCGGSNHGTEAA